MKRLTAISISIISMLGIVASGCATAPKGPTDQELIAKRIQDGMAAIKVKDFSAFDGFVSKSFSSDAVGDRATLLEFLKMADNAGQIDGLEIDLSEAKTVVTGTKSTVGPITARGNFGSLTFGFSGAKESGVWMITDAEPE